MRTITLAAALICMGVVGAWSADSIVDGGSSRFAAAAAPGSDATLELKWDSGTVRWWLIWYTGADTWVGNDFDVSTVAAYAAVQAIKLQARYDWPNLGWDGFRLGIFAFAGGVPGSLLWGPKFVKPTGSTGWKEFTVGWTLPTGVYQFVAAQEQYYNWPPNGDAFGIDNNPRFLGHSWQYLRGAWSPFEQSNIAPYRNLMIRVIVNNSTLAISPVSIGRVKALYY